MEISWERRNLRKDENIAFVNPALFLASKKLRRQVFPEIWKSLWSLRVLRRMAQVEISSITSTKLNASTISRISQSSVASRFGTWSTISATLAPTMVRSKFIIRALIGMALGPCAFSSPFMVSTPSGPRKNMSLLLILATVTSSRKLPPFVILSLVHFESQLCCTFARLATADKCWHVIISFTFLFSFDGANVI